MTLPRRAALAAFALLPLAARAQSTGSAIPERAMGPANARVTVQEWFSLTCPHCAEFAKVTFPTVKAELIDTGTIRYVWRAYPLDQVALMASMVARALPADRYEPFIATLLASQDRWAFARGVNNTEELAKYAALAGMPREQFNQAIANDALKQAILKEQDEAEKTLGITSTPSFVFNKTVVAGAIAYPEFQKNVAAAQA